jgi:hypothetical protein
MHCSLQVVALEGILLQCHAARDTSIAHAHWGFFSQLGLGSGLSLDSIRFLISFIHFEVQKKAL